MCVQYIFFVGLEENRETENVSSSYFSAYILVLIFLNGVGPTNSKKILSTIFANNMRSKFLVI